ncbi:hypothetical protein ACFQZI_00030 [Mucilaginibacter lutimaris]|uniref:DUF4105 domain-containing protein n=1 Tax=Mucilaginibacter lutimaris TaxID=931629 RepID=A0ABW2ZB44_9SPHI
MKNFLLIMIISAACLTGCKKEENFPNETVNSDTSANTSAFSVEELKNWYSTNRVHAKTATTSDQGSQAQEQAGIAWSNVKSGKMNNKPDQPSGNYLYVSIAGTPTFQNIHAGSRRLLFTKTSGQIRSFAVDVVPDPLAQQQNGTMKAANFTGRTFIYDSTRHNLIGGYIYINGKRAGTIKPAEKSGSKLQVSELPAGSTTCEWVQSNYVNADGELVIYAEKVCTVDLSDLSQHGPPDLPPIDQNPPEYAGGGGGSGSGGGSVSNLPGETNPKINPKAYMQCFSNLPDIGSKMTITVYVQEPAPGLPFNIGPNSVGHTAIGLTKTYNGQTITQVVGFYPDATGKDKMHAPSKVLDNAGLKYNVSISYSIIASEFNKIVNYIANPPNTYDLFTNNCTSFTYNACLAGGIKLPDPNGNMGLGQSGMTPAALGNSIRNTGNVSNANTKGGDVGRTHGPCNI